MKGGQGDEWNEAWQLKHLKTSLRQGRTVLYMSSRLLLASGNLYHHLSNVLLPLKVLVSLSQALEVEHLVDQWT